MIPARAWYARWQARPPEEAARIAAWLGVPDYWWAALPFIRMEDDDGEALACALDPPRVKPVRSYPPASEGDIDGLILAHVGTWDIGLNDDSDVMMWRPGGCSLLGDHRKHQLIGCDYDGVAHVYTSGTEYLRAWAARRMHHWRRCDRLGDFYDDVCLPGYLLIGDAARVTWPAGLTEIIAPPNISRDIEAAIFRQARLPRVTSQNVRISA